MTGIMIYRYDDKIDAYRDFPIEGTEDFADVASVGEWDYSWTMLGAWYSPSRDRFYWVAGSGCSCSSLMDGIHALGDFQDGDRYSLLNAIKAHFGNGYVGLSSEALDKELRAVRTWRYTPEEAA